MEIVQSPVKEVVEVPTKEEILAGLKRAQKGDPTSLPMLQAIVQNPKMVATLGGDLALRAQSLMVESHCGKNLLFQETIQAQMKFMRAELLGPNPTPVERLLVEAVLTAWLHYYHLEVAFGFGSELSPEQGAYYQRRLSAAQKRYLTAIKTLASVRKLAGPMLQINIAERQMNVAGTTPTVGEN